MKDKIYREIDNSFVESVEIDEFGRMSIHFENGNNYLCILSENCKITDVKAEKVREFLDKHPEAKNQNKTYTKP